MEFTQEFITENGLSEEQVAAVTGHFTSDVIPTLKKEYDGVANTNAEGILTGASNYAKEKLGFDLDRDKGEKVGDYLKRALDSKFSSTQSALDLKVDKTQDEINTQNIFKAVSFAMDFSDRVIADSGILESRECIMNEYLKINI